MSDQKPPKPKNKWLAGTEARERLKAMMQAKGTWGSTPPSQPGSVVITVSLSKSEDLQEISPQPAPSASASVPRSRETEAQRVQELQEADKGKRRLSLLD